MSQQKDPLDRLIDSTYAFGRVMRQQMLGQMKDGGGNLLHVHALFLISESEGVTMKQFAQALHVSSPSATSLVNRLTKMQWVGRLHDDQNRKLVRLYLTPLGKRILREKNDKRREVLRHIFGLLTASEQIQLANLHEKLSKKLFFLLLITMALSHSIPQIIRTHKKKTILGVILLILLGFGISRAMQPKQPEYITAVAAKGDLRQTVEAVGTVVSERELELRFGASGIVSSVSVREGDRVVAGQRLAQLKAGCLGANVASQQAALASSMADLQAMLEGSRPEDIAISQADLDNKKAALAAAEQTLESSEQNIAQSQQQLETIRAEANVNLAGQVQTSLSTVNEQLTTVENALSTIDDVLARTDVNDAVVKSRPQAPGEIQAQKRAALDAIAAARSASARAGTDYQAALTALRSARDAANAGLMAINSLFSLISSLPETQYFSASARETVKASIATDRSSIEDAAGNISSALSSLQNSAASYDTKIAAQQSTIVSLQGTRDRAKTDILTYQSGVRSAEAALRLKQAGARQTDIDAARARVRQAQANLARTRADYGDTILTAPVSGIVTHVNIRIGESLPAGAAITLLGQSPYRVEMFVSEIDIPKVTLTQSGSIELDAFRGTHFALRVGDIDPSATDKDGVPKYRVRLDFVYLHDNLKIGMTGDAEIVTGERSNVVSVPQRAVIENEEGKTIVRVLHDDKTVEEREVETGMEAASGDIEVDGIKEGETVIVLEKK